MDDSDFNKQLSLVRTIVGAILSIASILFLWKGISGIGEIGIDFKLFSGNFSTSSAGFALLVAGVILLSPQGSRKNVTTSEQRSLGQIILGIIFYIFIALLPVLSWLCISIYINYTNSVAAEGIIPVLGMYAFMSEIPLFFWAVSKITIFFTSGEKK